MDEQRLRFEIATIVMGLVVYHATHVGYEELTDFTKYELRSELFYDNDSIHWQDLPRYSTNMSDCWQVVEQMVKMASTETHVKFSEWIDQIQIWTLPEKEAATLICRAILTLYGLQNEKEVDDYAIPDYN